MNNQQIIITLSRFVGYIGVSISSLIFPILVYNISHSASIAGIVMLIEWIPKLFFYIQGGQIIHRITPKKAYYLIDILRAITFILFFCSAIFDNILFLLIAAPIAQSCNAISNIIFESLITCWWEIDKRISGHTQLMYLDLSAGIVIIPIISYLPMNFIIIIGGIIFFSNFLIGLFNKYTHVKPLHVDYTKTNLIDNLKQIFQHKKLILLSLMGISISTPIALISAQLPFFLNQFGQEFANSTSFISNFKAITAISAIIFLALIKHIKNMQYIFILSITLIYTTLIGLILSSNVYFFLGFLLFCSLGFYSYLIFSKNFRQELIPIEKRLEFTGILISIEAFSYILSALLMILFSSNLIYSLIFSLTFLTICLTNSPKIFKNNTN